MTSVSWSFEKMGDKWISTGTQVEMGILSVEPLEVSESLVEEESQTLDPYSTPDFEVPESTVEVAIASTSSVELGSSLVFTSGRRNYLSPY